MFFLKKITEKYHLFIITENHTSKRNFSMISDTHMIAHSHPFLQFEGDQICSRVSGSIWYKDIHQIKIVTNSNKSKIKMKAPSNTFKEQFSVLKKLLSQENWESF